MACIKKSGTFYPSDITVHTLKIHDIYQVITFMLTFQNRKHIKLLINCFYLTVVYKFIG